MPRLTPAVRVSFVLKAIAQLQTLQREMHRLSPRDEDYRSSRRALEEAIRELRAMISANVHSRLSYSR